MVLVTGGLGFIGSHVCRKLVGEGENVVVFDSLRQGQGEFLKKIRMPDFYDKVKFVNGDITDFAHLFETLKKYQNEKIIHTAAITFIPTAVENPSLTFKINTIGTFNLLEAARILDLKKFVYISTSSTYGDFQYTPADEKHPLEPKDIYGATKAAADRIAISYYRTYGLPVSVLRTSSVYGPGDLEKRVVKNFVENALTGKELEIHGGGNQRRDFSYVKDVAGGMVLALKSEKSNGEVFNITGGTDHTIRGLTEVVKKFIPNTQVRDVGARKVDINRGQLDIKKARELLGYDPRFNLEEGVKDYIKWMIEVYMPYFKLEVKNKPVFE